MGGAVLVWWWRSMTLRRLVEHPDYAPVRLLVMFGLVVLAAWGASHV